MIKQAAVNAVNADRPCDLMIGTVTKASPLEVMIDQKLTLTSAQLLLTRSVTDFTTEVTVEWTTEAENAHAHDVAGRKKVTVHNSLKSGDRVVLLRCAGGQMFAILDRLE